MKTLEERFWSKVEPEPNSGCWLWTAATNHCGYGIIGLGGRKDGVERAHRLSAKWSGLDTEGNMVLHRCDVPACVNPDHLFIGDAKTNALDMVAKGRACNGEKASYSKLTQKQVDEIRDRRRSGESERSIAKDYPVGRSMVGLIWRGERWGDRASAVSE